MIRICLLFVSSFFSCLLHAQLHVAKDLLSCSYGLKDSNEEWVIKPAYVYLAPLLNGYKAIDENSRSGFLSVTGKVVIPFDQHSIYEEKTFLFVTKDEKIGAYSDNGELRLTEEFDEIEFRENIYGSTIGFFAYKYLNDSIVESAYSDHNRVFFKNVKGYVTMLVEGNTRFFKLEEYKGKEHSKIGIIDLKGVQIIPVLYDYITLCHEYFTVYKNEKVSLLDMNNNVIIPMTNHFESISNGSNQSCYGKNDKYIVDGNSLYGFTNNQFKVIIKKGIYDTIIGNKNEYLREEGFACKVIKNNKTGYINVDGTVKIPPIYDEIIVLSGYIETEWGYYWKFLCKSNGKYCILDQEGNRLTAAVFQLLHTNGDSNLNRRSFYLKKNLDVFYISLDNDQIEKLPLIKALTDERVYKNGNIAIVLHNETETYSVGKVIGNVIACRDYPKPYLFVGLNGNTLLPNIMWYTTYKSSTLLYVHTANNNIGVISATSGTVIIDTLYQSVYKHQNKEIWLKNERLDRV